MKSEAKTKERLRVEREVLRDRPAQLKRVEAERKRAEEALRESYKQMERIFTVANEAIFVLDPLHDVIVSVNPRAAAMLGYEREELEGMPCSTIHPEEMERFRGFVENVRTIGSGFSDKLTCRTKEGRILPAEISASIFERGDRTLLVAMVHDLSERKQFETRLRESEERFRDLYESAPIAYFCVGADGLIRSCNEAAGELLGCKAEELTGRPVLELYTDAPQGKRKAALVFHRFLAGEQMKAEELQMRRVDGTPIWISLSVHITRDAEGQVEESRSMVVDITDRKRAEEMLRHWALHDPLTELPNRTLFNDRIAVAFAHAHRSNEMVAVLFLDLDHFKRVNDTLGHSVGDRLLQSAAHRLKSCLREGDTVARLGGDEFIVLTPGISVVEDALHLAQRMLGALEAPFDLDGHQLRITASMGVSLYPRDGEDPETLMRNADIAMYRAKKQGRNHYQRYTQDMRTTEFE